MQGQFGGRQKEWIFQEGDLGVFWTLSLTNIKMQDGQ